MAGKRITGSTQSSQAEEVLNIPEIINVENECNFNILYTNADCFTNKRSDLSILLGSLSFKPNVIVITEVNSKTFCNNLLESELYLGGYVLFSMNVAVVNKRGILVYVDSDLVSCQLDLDEDFSEFIFIKISNLVGHPVTIGAFYRSPGSTTENDLKMFKLINNVCTSTQGKLLLLGYFNLPNINWSNSSVNSNLPINSASYKFVSCLRDNFLTQHVQFPTRARGSQTPHILDLIISNVDFVEDIFNLSPLGKSDHSVLHCLCNLTSENSNVNVSKYNFSKGDYDGLCDYLNKCIDSNFYDDCSSVDDSWIIFKTAIECGQELFIPHIASNNWKKKNWQFPISNAFRDLI